MTDQSARPIGTVFWIPSGATVQVPAGDYWMVLSHDNAGHVPIERLPNGRYLLTAGHVWTVGASSNPVPQVEVVHGV